MSSKHDIGVDGACGMDARSKDELSIPDGPITRARSKRLKTAFQGFVQHFIDLELRACDKAYGGPSIVAYGGPSSGVKGPAQYVNLIGTYGPNIKV